MKTESIISEIRKKESFLCIGLDADVHKIPSYLLREKDPIFTFNKAIIDATHSFTIAYKPNIAFYESQGVPGWQSLKRTIDYLNANYPELFTIADAKRGDIGNTSKMYAKAFFEDLGFDAITVAPYMGKDSVEPFLEFDSKHAILLALTSNEGALDFQTLKCDNQQLYKHIIETSKTWMNSRNLMYVVGATKAEYFAEIRKLIPHNFLLVPGIGAQGGNLQEVCKFGITKDVGLIINSSRDIIYASNDKDFAKAAAEKTEDIQLQMKSILDAL